MAFPVVEARTSNRTTAVNTTSHAITLPAGIVAGELLLVAFSVDQDPIVTVDTGASGSKWTKLGQAKDTLAVTGAIFWKVAEGSDALTLTTSSTQQSSHVSFRISGADFCSGSYSSGSGINSDPPNHVPTDTQDYLWIATRAGDSTVTATVAPSSFSNLQTLAAAGTSGASINTAERSLNAASLDPGAFTSTTENWVCWTIAVGQLPDPADGAIILSMEVSEGASATTHTMPNPSGVQAGDLLVTVCSLNSNAAFTIDGASGPGWAEVGSRSRSTLLTLSVFSKVADGDDDLVLTTGSAGFVDFVAYRIQFGGDVDLGFADGSGGSADPPSLAPSGGSAPYLWIAGATADNTVEAAPSGFGPLREVGTFNYTGAAEKKETGASLDPGTFTNTGTVWVAGTISVGPLASAIATMTAEPGAFTLTGQDSGLLAPLALVADSAAFVLAGQDVDLFAPFSLQADAGAFILAGQDAGLATGLASAVLVADAGSFGLAGQDADLAVSITAISIAADAGSFALTGQAANLFVIAGENTIVYLTLADILLALQSPSNTVVFPVMTASGFIVTDPAGAALLAVAPYE